MLECIEGSEQECLEQALQGHSPPGVPGPLASQLGSEEGKSAGVKVCGDQRQIRKASGGARQVMLRMLGQIRFIFSLKT